MSLFLSKPFQFNYLLILICAFFVSCYPSEYYTGDIYLFSETPENFMVIIDGDRFQLRSFVSSAPEVPSRVSLLSKDENNPVTYLDLNSGKIKVEENLHRILFYKIETRDNSNEIDEYNRLIENWERENPFWDPENPYVEGPPEEITSQDPGPPVNISFIYSHEKTLTEGSLKTSLTADPPRLNIFYMESSR